MKINKKVLELIDNRSKLVLLSSFYTTSKYRKVDIYNDTKNFSSYMTTLKYLDFFLKRKIILKKGKIYELNINHKLQAELFKIISVITE